MRGAALLLALLLAPGLAAAQQPQQRSRQTTPAQPLDLGGEVDRNLRACFGNSRDMALVARCMETQRTAVAPRLERAVEQLLATQQDPLRRAALADVQASWAAYRDRRCDFAGTNPDRSTEAAADRAACLLQFDVNRTLEIEEILNPSTPAQRQPQQTAPRR